MSLFNKVMHNDIYLKEMEGFNYDINPDVVIAPGTFAPPIMIYWDSSDPIDSIQYNC